MKKFVIIILSTLFVFGILFRVCCGVFAIQPMGAIPKGATIFYWRMGLELPFIASADGILEDSGVGVSLLGRGLFLAKLANPILEREIMRIEYSESLYLISTNGKKCDK
jgi:hypothetical protein